jgi:CBS-domain-containing membrane protein
MRGAVERLKSLTVRDVMARDVVSVSANQSLAEAAAVLRGRKVAWAPVVDEAGRCVGVLSATDLLERQRADDDALAMQSHGIQRDEGRPIEIAPDSQYVSAMMTQAVQSVRPEVAVLMAARMMCAGHIHRLPVLDQHDRPVGVVSTMDVVAAMLGAIEESSGGGVLE